MSRCLMFFTSVLWCIMMWYAIPVQAGMPFQLPDCVTDFGTEVVLNPPLLEAMIAQAEPTGRRPNAAAERFFIVVKYYLEKSHGLLLISREDPTQHPLLVTNTCAPYPEAPAHIRAYIASLSEDQNKALMVYRDLLWPQAERAHVPAGTMAPVPAGNFTSGNGTTVRLDAFTIDVYEVTNAQYRQFIEAGGYTTRKFWSDEGWVWLQRKKRHQPSYWDNQHLKAPKQPVVGVSWYEAAAYCRWAGKALPTELQWEKACRGTDGRRFPWGNEPLSQAGVKSKDHVSFTIPARVGSGPQTPSPYGVYDMAGNVLEWTQTARDGRQMVLCGGSGDSHTQHVGCGVRYTLLPGISANFIGFRCQSPGVSMHHASPKP